MEKPHAIRAGHDAIPAPDAPLPVHEDHPVCGLIGCPYRAYLDTGRFFTLIAKLGHKKSLINFFFRNIFVPSLAKIHPARDKAIPRFLGCIREYFSLFGDNVSFHPGPGDIGLEGDFIFELTRLDTEAAPDTLVGIHQKYPADRLQRSMKDSRLKNFVQPFG
jgi:hypothetical protein